MLGGLQPRTTWSARFTGARTRLNQSCGAACAAPVNASTGEILVPTATRTGQIVEKVIQATATAQGLLALERALTGTELDHLEAVLRDCVAQAHVDVNESYPQRNGGSGFKNGKFPDDAECDRIVGLTEKGQPITLAQELGSLKHAAAFTCIQARLSKDFGDNFSVEPRYKGDPNTNGIVLTNEKRGSLVPDLVVHATRNATQVQCVYELKFPCHERYRLNPLSSPGVDAQLKSYQNLSNRCPVALVTPSGLLQPGIDP